jgi:hypothetical protein
LVLGSPATHWYGLPSADKGSWHHLAIVKDSAQGDQNIYYDGKLVALPLDTADSLDDIGSQGLSIGKLASDDLAEYDWRYGWQMLKGRLDDLRVYDYALTQPEVVSLADETEVYQAVISNANIYTIGDDVVNFKDYALILGTWLDEQTWP